MIYQIKSGEWECKDGKVFTHPGYEFCNAKITRKGKKFVAQWFNGWGTRHEECDSVDAAIEAIVYHEGLKPFSLREFNVRFNGTKEAHFLNGKIHIERSQCVYKTVWGHNFTHKGKDVRKLVKFVIQSLFEVAPEPDCVVEL